MTAFGIGSLQMILDEIDHVVMGWVLKSNDFYSYKEKAPDAQGGRPCGSRRRRVSAWVKKHREPREKAVGCGKRLSSADLGEVGLLTLVFGLTSYSG